MDSEPELTYTFLLNYYIKHQLHQQELPKVPQYTRKAYVNWYERNKDNEDFKDRRAIANKKAYEKRKERILSIENDLATKVPPN
jgi:hypothetical protein